MNICIFCPKDSRVAAKIKLEAESRGHQCRRLRFSDLYLEANGISIEVKHRKYDLNEFDTFIFRKISNGDSEITAVLAKQLSTKNKRVLDLDALLSNNSFYELIVLADAKIPFINKVFTSSIKSSRDVLIDLDHPIIVKPLDLKQERYSFSEDWTESYDIVRTEKSKRYEFEEAIESNEFIRVYLLGGKVVGAILHHNIDEEKKLNTTSKTSLEEYQLSPELEELSIKTANALNYKFCSIDYFQSEDGFKVMNINRSPNFAKYNKIFNEKLEKLFLDYLESGQ